MFASKLRDLRRRRRSTLLEIDADLWEKLRDELRERGRNERESGAFLLGDIPAGRPRRARHAIYYDDLDEDCLTGGISFDGAAYGRLWDICEETGLRVVADTHTHPGSGVAQSSTDRDHPMLARPQHVALILPNYSNGPISPADVGVHQYLSDGNWDSFLLTEASKRLRIKKRWPWTR